MRIDTTIEAVAEQLKEQPKKLKGVISAAARRALASGRTLAVNELTKEYTLKATRVRPKFSMKVPRGNWTEDFAAELVYKNEASTPLDYYKHRPTTDTTGRNRKAVRVQIKSGMQIRVTDGFRWSGAATPMILRRQGKASRPTYRPTLGSTVNILARDEFVDEFNTHVSEVFEKRVEHEIGRVLKG